MNEKTNLYRLMVWHEKDESSIVLDGLTITKEPLFIKTSKVLDEHRLFNKGIAVKKYESLPDHIKIVDYDTNNS